MPPVRSVNSTASGCRIFHRALGKLDAHEENDHGDDQARNVLQPPVTEGMLGVGLVPQA